MRFYALVADKYLLCSHLDKLDDSEIRIDHAEFVTMVEISYLHMLLHVKS